MEISDSRVIEYLYIGDRKVAKDKDRLQHLGITYIVNCTTDIRHYFENDSQFKYHRCPINDTDVSDVTPYLNDAVEFIHEGRSLGHSVLVHCQQGVSRSASIVIAYLIKYEGMPLAKAYASLRKERAQVKPKSNFLSQLIRWEKTLKENPYHSSGSNGSSGLHANSNSSSTSKNSLNSNAAGSAATVAAADAETKVNGHGSSSSSDSSSSSLSSASSVSSPSTTATTAPTASPSASPTPLSSTSSSPALASLSTPSPSSSPSAASSAAAQSGGGEQNNEKETVVSNGVLGTHASSSASPRKTKQRPLSPSAASQATDKRHKPQLGPSLPPSASASCTTATATATAQPSPEKKVPAPLKKAMSGPQLPPFMLPSH